MNEEVFLCCFLVEGELCGLGGVHFEAEVEKADLAFVRRKLCFKFDVRVRVIESTLDFLCFLPVDGDDEDVINIAFVEAEVEADIVKDVLFEGIHK